MSLNEVVSPLTFTYVTNMTGLPQLRTTTMDRSIVIRISYCHYMHMISNFDWALFSIRGNANSIRTSAIPFTHHDKLVDTLCHYWGCSCSDMLGSSDSSPLYVYIVVLTFSVLLCSKQIDSVLM